MYKVSVLIKKVLDVNYEQLCIQWGLRCLLVLHSYSSQAYQGNDFHDNEQIFKVGFKISYLHHISNKFHGEPQQIFQENAEIEESFFFFTVRNKSTKNQDNGNVINHQNIFVHFCCLPKTSGNTKLLEISRKKSLSNFPCIKCKKSIF
jgi:hypothetical protein